MDLIEGGRERVRDREKEGNSQIGRGIQMDLIEGGRERVRDREKEGNSQIGEEYRWTSLKVVEREGERQRERREELD